MIEVTRADQDALCRMTLLQIRDHIDDLLASPAQVEAVLFGASRVDDDDLLAAGAGDLGALEQLRTAQALSIATTPTARLAEG